MKEKAVCLSCRLQALFQHQSQFQLLPVSLAQTKRFLFSYGTLGKNLIKEHLPYIFPCEQFFGSESGLDPESNGSVNPDREPDPGRSKVSLKTKKIRNFLFRVLRVLC
jgi:hypothetical protein